MSSINILNHQIAVRNPPEQKTAHEKVLSQIVAMKNLPVDAPHVVQSSNLAYHVIVKRKEL